MADVMLPSSENFRNVFFNIKERTDKILSRFYDDSIIESPSVDIRAIADNIGIKDIIFVSPDIIQDDHSHLTKYDIILLNEEDSPEEQNFSIAHEIAHFTSRENDVIDIARGEAEAKIEKLKYNLLNFYTIILSYSKQIAKIVTAEIGKPVTEKKAYQLLTRIANNSLLTNEKNFLEKVKGVNREVIYYRNMLHVLIKEMDNNFLNILKRIYDEEIADYFAANLLVPTEQFILWQNKPTEEIAKAFKVDKRCIEKRKYEIQYELDFIMPKDLASDINLENQIPLSSDELCRLAGGLAIHDGA